MGRPAQFATSYIAGQEDKRMNNRTMFPALKNNAGVGFEGPMKIELFKGVGLLPKLVARTYNIQACQTS